MRSLLVILILSSTALAGCADGAPKEVEDSTTLDADLVATSKTGVIRGIIVDATITPVPGVTVALSGSGASTETNENGEFGFSDLEPGTYFLSATKLGWSDVQQSVDVKAGVEKPPLVKVQMVVVPGKQPFNQGYQFEGIIVCSVRYFIEGRTPCPGSEFIQDIQLSKTPDWVVSEMTWESTQQLGGEMSFNIRRTDTSTDSTDVEGTSPLSLTVNRTLAEKDQFGPDMDMRIIVFTSHLKETEPPAGGLWGVGLQVDQKFTVFTHAFFNYVPPQDWRFLEDPSVPQPPA